MSICLTSHLRLIQINGRVDTEDDRDFINNVEVLLSSENAHYPIVVTLNSIGGNVLESLEISDFIWELHNSKIPIYIHVIGDCMSSGMTILGSVPIEYRYVSLASCFFIHQLQASIKVRNYRKAKQKISGYDTLERVSDGYIKPMFKDPNLYETLNEQETYFLTNDAIEYGIIKPENVITSSLYSVLPQLKQLRDQFCELQKQTSRLKLHQAQQHLEEVKHKISEEQVEISDPEVIDTNTNADETK